jgi:TonB-dependent starch-binding outer membrane protein SusC
MQRKFVLSLALLLALPVTVFGQATGTVSGSVTGANGQPLVGASVAVAGTTRGDQTDAQGRYTITTVPIGSRTVRATAAGYAEASRTVTVAAGQTATVNIPMTQQAVQLEQIVAIGYGTARRRDVTGSVTSVTAEELQTKAAPTAALSTALQGKAPGVQVVTNSGTPGGNASVRVRGTNSISGSSEPLYVYDGIPAAQGSAGNDAIDPNNIESIQILKDASATAIYGARGANGVVLITTKKGTRGQSQIQLESSYGIQNLEKTIPMMNSQEWMTMANLANTTAGIAPRYTQAQIDAAQTYDLVDMITRSSVPQQSHGVTFSGGDANTRLLVAGNYLEQKGVVVNSNFERYGARVNLDHNMSSKFRIGVNLSGARSVQNIGPEDGGITRAMEFAPNINPGPDSLGNYPKFSVTSDQTENPLARDVLTQQPVRVTRLLTSGYAELDLATGLRARSTIGGNFGFNNNPVFIPRTDPSGGVGGIARRTWSDSREITSSSQLTYNREVGPGSLDLLAGFDVQKARSENTVAEARTFPTDALGYYQLNTGALLVAPTADLTESALVSWLGRANYNLLDRYVFTVTGRRDGSSRFGENNKWAFFPSAAFAWRVVDESFMQNQDVFSDAKVRISYGRTGNQGVPAYGSLARLSAANAVFSNGIAPTFAPSTTAPNPDVKWEVQSQINAGVDLGFLDNRITLTADAYQATTTDLLLDVTLPNFTGFTSQTQNVGSIRNRGYEFSVNTVNWEGDQFSWRSNFNIATNKNEVIALFNGLEFLPNPGTFITKVGEPLSTIYGWKVNGLYQAGDACNLQNKTECAPGEFKITDLDKDGVINNNDREILGNADPKFYGGFTNNLAYGPVSLDAFFNFTQGNKVVNQTAQRTSLLKGVFNERKAVLDYWTPQNTDTEVPRPNAARVNRLYSTLIEDGSFVRLQALTLGYVVPERLIPGANAARLYLTGQNLWVSTKYSGFDPEVSSNGGAANNTTNNTARGVDASAYPRSRIWNLGVNLTF